MAPKRSDAHLHTPDGWTHHVRSTGLQALRYSRFVAVMRHALPLMAVAVLGVVLAYALYPRGDRSSLSYESANQVKGDLTMKKPRLSGTDTNGNPYLITADTAVQQGKNARKVALQTVDADLQYEGSRWANANAGHGFIDFDAKMLTLTQGLSVFTDSGYEMHTTSAVADLNQNTIVGHEPVNGQGPMGTFRADSFSINRQTRHLTLIGNVHMKLYPKKVKS